MTIWACQAGKDVYVEKPLQPQHPRGPHRRRGGPQVQPHRPARHAEPQQQRAGPTRSPRSSSRASYGKLLVSHGLLLQAARQHRHQAETARRRRSSTSTSGSARRRAAVPRQPRPLQLALVLGLRQRRHRQPGRPPDGHRPLGDPRRARCPRASSASAAASATRTRAQTPNTQIAVFDYGDDAADLRGPRPRREAQGVPGQKVGNESFTTEAASSPAASSTRRASDKAEPLPKVERQGDAGRRRSATSSPRCAAARSRTSTPTSRTGTIPAPCATWRTSRTAWASRCRSAARRSRWATTGRSSRRSQNLVNNVRGIGVNLEETTYQVGQTLTFDPKDERFVGDGRTRRTRC